MDTSIVSVSGSTNIGLIDDKRILQAESEPGNWLAHGRTYEEQRFSPLKQINKESISDLGLVWSKDMGTNRALEATPIVVDGIMFFTSTWSRVYAVDALTGGIKLVADGAIGSRGAVFFKKYEDYDTEGLLILKKEETMPTLIKALKKGIQIETHAIGDLGNKVVLDWYEEAFNEINNEERAIASPRWRIEHSQNIRPEDQIRFRDLEVIASMQPSHAIGDLHFHNSLLI